MGEGEGRKRTKINVRWKHVLYVWQMAINILLVYCIDGSTVLSEVLQTYKIMLNCCMR